MNMPYCNFSAIREPSVIYSVALSEIIIDEINKTGYDVKEYIKKAIVAQLKNDHRDLCRKCDYGFHDYHVM